MRLSQIICFGISALIGNTVWNVFHETDPERVGAAFGGSFSMLVTLALASWVFGK